MDPTANLRKQLLLSSKILDAKDPAVILEAAAELADLIEALDEWLHMGGTLPRQWEKPCVACGAKTRDQDR